MASARTQTFRYGLFPTVIALVASPAMATERYTEAGISQIETGEKSVLAFLEFVSGDSPPQGNGAQCIFWPTPGLRSREVPSSVFAGMTRAPTPIAFT